MKKLIALMLVLVLALSVVACAPATTTPTPTTGTNTDPNAALAGTYDITMWISEMDGMTEMTQVMLADDFWSFGTDPEANNFYYLQSNEIHQTLKGRFFLYNAFIDCVFK